MATAPDALKLFLRRLTLAYTVFLALVLLMPFRFALDPALLAANARNVASLWFAESVLSPSVVADTLQNIALFMPFGFFRRAAGAATRRAAGEAFLVSLGAESLQLLAPGRCASLYDLVCNTAGAWAGAAVFSAWGGFAERALRAARRRVPRRLAVCCAAAGLLAVLATMFLKVAPVEGRAWEGAVPVFLGGAPGDVFAWRGVIHRIALWREATESAAAAAPDVDIDFRGGPKEGFLASLPADAAWSEEGLELRGARVVLAPAQAEAFAQVAGTGRPFSACVWLSPERMDYTQRGAIVSAGESAWRCAFRLGQRERDVQFFVRTSVSGADWDRPALTARAGGERPGGRQWRFIFTGDRLAAAFEGVIQPEGVILRRWATPAGQLLASPFVFEPLTLYAAMFLAVAFLAGLASPPGLRGAAGAAAFACIAPAFGVAALSAYCGLPIDRYAVAAVLLAAALGVPLGRAWACAASAG
ncbi:MAG TPA: VanZ family protein [Planctomycetota bacterium]|jgi:VanZ family protein|nr:VanZ family protein [Planctomycetota bacterium]OQC22211.1 MAG: VanZ like family protein [Planctomycetes bacterium ADurb.Bin069]HNS00055.1 VanZ family protein [Planctomycetota bacterium]HNU25394.1 VanZ family protein [Planctomycetota bacterium]HOE29337.1 VanZ family protein [Planctomycetota bacterium]